MGGSFSSIPIPSGSSDLDRFSEWTEVVKIVKRFDLIEIHRGHYSHFVMYVGGCDHYIVHVTQIDGETPEGKAALVREKLDEVIGKNLCRINNLSHKFKYRLPDEEIEKNISFDSDPGKIYKLVDYNLYNNNCEHYCARWRFDKAYSSQVIRGGAGAGILSTVGLFVVGSAEAIIYAPTEAAKPENTELEKTNKK